jgi:hypothetical protein
MMKPENNQYQNPYIPASNWNKTPDGEVCTLDEYLLSRDVLPLVRKLYGVQNPDNLAVYVLEVNWAQNNPDLVGVFFSKDKLTSEIRLAMGY